MIRPLSTWFQKKNVSLIDLADTWKFHLFISTRMAFQFQQVDFFQLTPRIKNVSSKWLKQPILGPIFVERLISYSVLFTFWSGGMPVLAPGWRHVQFMSGVSYLSFNRHWEGPSNGWQAPASLAITRQGDAIKFIPPYLRRRNKISLIPENLDGILNRFFVLEINESVSLLYVRLPVHRDPNTYQRPGLITKKHTCFTYLSHIGET
jgi:hypothetical protein